MSLRDLAVDLLAIPSHEDESAAGDFVESWLREHTAADVTRDVGVPDAGGGGNVVARKGAGPSVALVGHHDVVPPDESQVQDDGYRIQERDDRLHARGSADMKGALAAAMTAFRDCDPAGELVFASFVAEEQGGLGARAATDRGFAPDYAVLGEGTTGYSATGVTDVAVAHKGRRGSTITARGHAAHASEPATGENAIYTALEAVDELQDVDAPETTVLGHDVEGSIAVTEIEGGSAWNVIPERCAVTVDERTVPGERAPIERVQAIDGVEHRVDQDLPPMRCSDADFADVVLDSAGDCQEEAPESIVKPHATDAGRLAAAGTACVVCGPAEAGEAHSSSESVSIEVLERCSRIYRRVAERWPR